MDFEEYLQLVKAETESIVDKEHPLKSFLNLRKWLKGKEKELKKLNK